MRAYVQVGRNAEPALSAALFTCLYRTASRPQCMTNSYPGDHASPVEMNRLADFYRAVAHRCSGSILIGDPISAGPMRLLAIHSIELNLSAYLLLQVHPGPQSARWATI